jgi:hypothetical protein
MKSEESEIHRQERQQHPDVAEVSKVVEAEGEFHPPAEPLRCLLRAPKAAVVAAAEGEFRPLGLLLIFE